VENARNGQDQDDTGANLNISNDTSSKGSDISKKHTVRNRRQNATNNKNLESGNIDCGRKVGRNTQICSDSESEEVNLTLLAQTSEHPEPEHTISSRSTTNKVRNVILDSESEAEEENLSLLAPTSEHGDPEHSISSGTTRNKVRNAILDSDSEAEEINLNSLYQKGDISDTKRSETHGSSIKTTNSKLSSIVLDSDSENEVITVKAQRTSSNSYSIPCALDSDVDNIHSNKSSKAVFSVDEANTVETKKRHLDEEMRGSTDVQKRCRVALSDDGYD
jgi:hypothetical protein